MEINNRYQINDFVYFMQDNKIKRGYVYRYKIDVNTIWEMQTHNYKPTDRLNINIFYKICTDSYNKTGTEFIHECLLFKTKEELLKSL